MTTFRDRLRTTISNTPGTGSCILSTASVSYLTWGTTENGLFFDILVEDGTDWELAEQCLYTFSTNTLTRGTFIKSSTGSPLVLTSAAIVTNILLAKRMVIPVDTVANTFYGGL